jgi:hypothetical protein
MPNYNRARRLKRGGSNERKISFQFSVTISNYNIPNPTVKVEDYPKMLSAWYRDRNEEHDDFDNIRDVKISYNPSTKLFEGVGYVNDTDGLVSEEDIKSDLEIRVDPDDDGNYAIIIKKNAPNISDYEIYDGEDNNYENNNRNNYNKVTGEEIHPEVYIVSGKLISYAIAKPHSMPADEIASLPIFTPSNLDYSNGVNALAMGDIENGAVIAFIKSSSGKIHDNQGIIVYKANGEPTDAYIKIFNDPSPTNPFTREKIQMPADVVLKRIVLNSSTGGRRKISKKTRKSKKRQGTYRRKTMRRH